jgi:hypothetical protein
MCTENFIIQKEKLKGHPALCLDVNIMILKILLILLYQKSNKLFGAKSKLSTLKSIKS